MTTSHPDGHGAATAWHHLPKREQSWRWALGLALALAVQLVVVYAPSGPGGPEITGLDKVVHLVIFAAPAFAALMLGIPARWALGLLVVHAPTSELIQHFLLPHRDGDVFDVLADLCGVLLGALAYMVWSRRQH
ncbi:MAG: VanZ family protein [Dermatophilaceae bacterium]